MSKFILNKALSEHHCFNTNGEQIDHENSQDFSKLYFQNCPDKPIYNINVNGAEKRITTSYYIGVDWIIKNEIAIQVEPKIDTHSLKTDFLGMFLHALKHPGISSYTSQLYEIKFDEPHIAIKKEDDFLTPLLVLRFLYMLKDLTKKGLRRDYITVTRNLSGKVKGKILISQTIKKNHFQGNRTKTFCDFQEYSFDCVENRILKKAFLFCIKYANSLKINVCQEVINYISPSFEKVSSEVELDELRNVKHSGIYKEYNEALKLAKLILKRFGHNVNSINNTDEIKMPPFWIDMSLLFELYVLGLLKDRFGEEVTYHFTHSGNELDFLLKSKEFKFVIDAKYKPRYNKTKLNDDIRQVSGYARLKKVYEHLGVIYPESVDCLIIYPDQENGSDSLCTVNFKEKIVEPFLGIYKTDVKLPLQAHVKFAISHRDNN